MSRFLVSVIATAVLLGVYGCATESSRSVEVAKVESAATPFRGTRVPISVGKFDNRSGFMRGIFTDGVDRLGSQAKTPPISPLQQPQRSIALDRENLAETKQEGRLKSRSQPIRAANSVARG